jgi:hypothetical protein
MDLVKPFGYYFQICRDSFLQNPFLLHKSSHFILFAVETESLQTHKGTLLSWLLCTILLMNHNL